MSGCPTVDDNFDHRVKVVTARSLHCEVAFFSFVTNKFLKNFYQ